MVGSSTALGADLRRPILTVVRRAFCIYNKAVFVWGREEARSQSPKHGFDFKDAGLVYDHPAKITFDSPRTWNIEAKI